MSFTAKDGVVIATEKKIPSVLIDEEHFDKIEYITDSIGAIYAGVGPDSRVLIRKAQKKAQAYYLTYGVSSVFPR